MKNILYSKWHSKPSKSNSYMEYEENPQEGVGWMPHRVHAVLANNGDHPKY